MYLKQRLLPLLFKLHLKPDSAQKLKGKKMHTNCFIEMTLYLSSRCSILWSLKEYKSKLTD